VRALKWSAHLSRLILWPVETFKKPTCVLGQLEISMSTSVSSEIGSVQTPGEPKRLYALIGAFILAGALSACAVFPKSSNPTADASITSDVRSRLAQEAEFISPLGVQTVNGVVYLNGKTYTGLQRRDAEGIALQANDVVRVVNDIEIIR
jgi:hypothetical protein